MGGGISSLDNGHQSVNRAVSWLIAFQSEPQWITHLEASKATTKLMVDFTATWCGPCRWMELTLNELAEKSPDVEFIEVDVNELAVGFLSLIQLEFGVEAMPKFLFVRNGAVVDRIVVQRRVSCRRKLGFTGTT